MPHVPVGGGDTVVSSDSDNDQLVMSFCQCFAAVDTAPMAGDEVGFQLQRPCSRARPSQRAEERESEEREMDAMFHDMFVY